MVPELLLSLSILPLLVRSQASLPCTGLFTHDPRHFSAPLLMDGVLDFTFDEIWEELSTKANKVRIVLGNLILCFALSIRSWPGLGRCIPPFTAPTAPLLTTCLQGANPWQSSSWETVPFRLSDWSVSSLGGCGVVVLRGVIARVYNRSRRT